MTEEYPRKTRIAGKIAEIWIGAATPFEAWGFYIFSNEFADEPELKNKLMVLYLAAAFDLVEAETRHLPAAIKEAEDEGFSTLAENGKQLKNIGRAAAKLLSLFSTEEQLFIQAVRNTWVHGYLAGRHSDTIKAKLVRDGAIDTVSLTHKEYHDRVRPIYERGELDDTLSEIRARAISSCPEYWKGIEEICSVEDIHQLLIEDCKFLVVPPE